MSSESNNGRPVSIITGGGTGIGRAIAKRMVKHGRVVLVGRRPDPLHETGASLGQENTDWIAVSADVSVMNDRSRIVESTLATFGRIDNLINNAAIGTCSPLTDLSEGEIEQLVTINLTAPILLTRLAMPQLIEHGGCVVSIGSRAAVDPFPGLGTYGCTKAGLEGLARCIANEYSEHGVRAYTVHPGAVETDMLRSIVSAEDLPSDQVLVPDDIAETVERFVFGPVDEANGKAVVVAK